MSYLPFLVNPLPFLLELILTSIFQLMKCIELAVCNDYFRKVRLFVLRQVCDSRDICEGSCFGLADKILRL